jgi:hypothetical protein
VSIIIGMVVISMLLCLVLVLQVLTLYMAARPGMDADLSPSHDQDEAPVLSTLPRSFAKSKAIDPIFINDETAYKLENENQ